MNVIYSLFSFFIQDFSILFVTSLRFYPPDVELANAVSKETYNGGSLTIIIAPTQYIQEDGYLFQYSYARENNYLCYIAIWRPVSDLTYTLVHETNVPQGPLHQVQMVELEEPFLVKKFDVIGIHTRKSSPPDSNVRCISELKDQTSEYPFHSRLKHNCCSSLGDTIAFDTTTPTRFYLLIAGVVKDLLKIATVKYLATFISYPQPTLTTSIPINLYLSVFKLQLKTCSNVEKILVTTDVQPNVNGKISFHLGHGYSERLRTTLCNHLSSSDTDTFTIKDDRYYFTITCKRTTIGRYLIVKSPFQFTFTNIYIIGQPAIVETPFYSLSSIEMKKDTFDQDCQLSIQCLKLCQSLQNCSGISVTANKSILHFGHIFDDMLITSPTSIFHYKTCSAPTQDDYC
ncbi:DgyrCDS3213 [Dimorphilus gyrociliatus]|uniref:DgyrCDS3213 n=1 Tax=Dimorphilus gyrociliatus TaxID=2664684 RepID=A0A7I8VFJ3_9ANNE|nr:DgyrCDS3213 [Dimorphilus gyrociliatus]